MNAASARMLHHFVYDHLAEVLMHVSKPVCLLAHDMAQALDSEDATASAEVTAGLRKLLEAKDCFVRAQVILGKGHAAS